MTLLKVRRLMSTKTNINTKFLTIILLNLWGISSLILFLFLPKTIINYTELYIFSSFLYLILCVFVFKYDVSKNGVLILTLVWFVVKAISISYNPIGSDDYYRYLWDGKVQINGINPFLYAPQDLTLTSLHSELLPDKVSFPHIKTIYFPVAQALFTLSFAISGENIWGLKLFLLLSDIMILISLYFLLIKFHLPLKYLLFYSTLPFIYFQFIIDSHIDLVGAALMLGAITLYLYQKKHLGFILLGLSMLVKPTALLLLPFLFQHENSVKQKIIAFILPLLILGFSFAPYIFVATPLETLINYTENWTFNGMVYNIIKIFSADNFTIRIICGLLYIVVYATLFFSKLDFLKKIYLSIFLLMIFSPVVHPWYLIWFVVFLPLIQNFSGLYFVSAVSLTFFTVLTYQTTGVWKEYPIVLLTQYLPLFVLFIYEIFNNNLKEDIINKSILEKTNKY